MLILRMVLYFAAAGAAGAGIASYDETAQTLTMNLDDLAVIIAGVGGYIATFWSSRVAKRKGGET